MKLPTCSFKHILPSLTLVVSVFFTILLSRELSLYFPLNKPVPAKIIQWEVVEKNDLFSLRANYSFEYLGGIWMGSHNFKPIYPSESAAVADLKEKAKTAWTAWIDPWAPSLSMLERRFPYNLFVRTLICYGVTLYFFLFFGKKFNRIS